MLILGIESTAKAASVALVRDGETIGTYSQRSGLTHSQTLLPMAQALLQNTGTALGELDCVAVAWGPGSFTGVRIGVATAKGLCWGADIGAVGVSTLEAMSWLALSAPAECVICPAMDARRSQVYNALFELREGKPMRLTPDRAVSAEVLCEELRGMGRPVYVLGDGWEVMSAALTAAALPHTVAPEPIRWQSAWGVCMAAADKTPQNAETLLPVYLRLSQAERERQERLEKESK